jgi:hypothetical protein
MAAEGKRKGRAAREGSTHPVLERLKPGEAAVVLEHLLKRKRQGRYTRAVAFFAPGTGHRLIRQGSAQRGFTRQGLSGGSSCPDGPSLAEYTGIFR